MAGSDYETDRERHASIMRYSEGWANDPTWSQHKRAKPTKTDPEDDMKVDSTMPIGTTSKKWNPKVDDQFWHRQSKSDEYRGSSSMSSSST